jgi:DNA-directed RNA polymerase subunit RPC12/RpoP
MPANLVRCATCRALLNDDLRVREVSAPEFAPLKEIEPVIQAAPSGYYATCPQCGKELRIHGKYAGRNVACRFCNSEFRFEVDPPSLQVVAFYLNCPHCSRELKAASKYLGAKVACKHCNGGIQVG